MRIVKLNVADLKFDFDVRLSGNDLDKVNQIADFLKNGGKTEPIVVNKDRKVIEGRQRLAAHKQIGLAQIEAVVEEFEDRNDERIFAMKSQLNVASPLSSEDIRWNIRQLILNGATSADIINELAPTLTYGLAKRYVDDAHSTLNKERIALAIKSLGNGEAMSSVVKKHKVTSKQIQDSLTRKAEKIKSQTSIPKSVMGTSFRSVSRKVEAQREAILIDINEGLITDREALDIISHTVSLIDKVKKRADDALIRIKQAVELRKKL